MILGLGLVEAAERSCSGRRLPRSTYSHAIIFCTNFGGIAGQPGNAVKGAAGSLTAGVIAAGRGVVGTAAVVLVLDVASE